MAGKVKTWVWIVVGIAVFCVLALVAVVGGAFFYMSRYIETKSATPASALSRPAVARFIALRTSSAMATSSPLTSASSAWNSSRIGSP